MRCNSWDGNGPGSTGYANAVNADQPQYVMEYNMKTMLMMAGLAFLLGTTTLAAAGEHGCCKSTSFSVTVGNEKTDVPLACNMVAGNYNAGDKLITCPERGSGPDIQTFTREFTTCREHQYDARS
jgi:hypothetical protein